VQTEAIFKDIILSIRSIFDIGQCDSTSVAFSPKIKKLSSVSDAGPLHPLHDRPKTMPPFLVVAKYAASGVDDLAKSKAVNLELRLKDAMSKLGGTLVSLYFTPDFDIFMIVDTPSTAPPFITSSMVASGVFTRGIDIMRLDPAESFDETVELACKFAHG
jgi:hypothetical protein